MGVKGLHNKIKKKQRMNDDEKEDIKSAVNWMEIHHDGHNIQWSVLKYHR